MLWKWSLIGASGGAQMYCLMVTWSHYSKASQWVETSYFFLSSFLVVEIWSMGLETWKMCICCSSLPGPWVLSTDPSPFRLSHHIEGPLAGDPMGLFYSRKAPQTNLPYQNSQILPTPAIQHQASMESSFGLKHVWSQGTAANSRGPETKHCWDESQPTRTSRNR